MAECAIRVSLLRIAVCVCVYIDTWLNTVPYVYIRIIMSREMCSVVGKGADGRIGRHEYMAGQPRQTLALAGLPGEIFVQQLAILPLLPHHRGPTLYHTSSTPARICSSIDGYPLLPAEELLASLRRTCRDLPSRRRRRAPFS